MTKALMNSYHSSGTRNDTGSLTWWLKRRFWLSDTCLSFYRITLQPRISTRTKSTPHLPFRIIHYKIITKNLPMRVIHRSIDGGKKSIIGFVFSIMCLENSNSGLLLPIVGFKFLLTCFNLSSAGINSPIIGFKKANACFGLSIVGFDNSTVGFDPTNAARGTIWKRISRWETWSYAQASPPEPRGGRCPA